MRHLKLYENFQPTDIFVEGYAQAWEKYKKDNPNWDKDIAAAQEIAVELALQFYKDPDDAERAADAIIQAKNEPGNKLAEGVEDVTVDQQKAIDVLNDEMDWNVPNIKPATEEDVKIYTHARGITTENGIIYWGMAGQSILKDIKAALEKANIKARVFRGYETTRGSDEHDYIIVLTK